MTHPGCRASISPSSPSQRRGGPTFPSHPQAQVNIELRIVCSGDADLKLLASMLNAVNGTGLPYTVGFPPMPPVPAAAPVACPPSTAAAVPSAAPAPIVVAEPMVGVLREPPVTKSPETQAALDKIAAEQDAQAKAAPVAPADAADPLEKRRPGRPHRKTGDGVPVPRPEGGYGDQPQGPRFIETKRVLQAILFRWLADEKQDYAAFQKHLVGRYGDGTFKTVPEGNYDALVAEAKAGPKGFRAIRDDELAEALASIEAELTVTS
jgi:hypothetical protein